MVCPLIPWVEVWRWKTQSNHSSPFHLPHGYQAQVCSRSFTSCSSLQWMGHLVKKWLLLLCGGTWLLRTASKPDPGYTAWIASLFHFFAIWRRRVSRTAIFSSPLGGEKFFQKICIFLGFWFPPGVTQSFRLVWTSLHPDFCAPAALSGHQSQSFTQLFIILISILPFPSSHYLSLLSKLTWHTTHPLPEGLHVYTPPSRGKRIPIGILS